MTYSAKDDQTALVFAAVFVIVWVGAGVVTLNAALLGGKMSAFVQLYPTNYLHLVRFYKVCAYWDTA